MGATTTALRVSKLRGLLERSFPGAEIHALRRETRPGRIGGVLVWERFRHKDQFDRQQELWTKLKAELDAGEMQQIGLILTVTPDEYRAFTHQ